MINIKGKFHSNVHERKNMESHGNGEKKWSKELTKDGMKENIL